MMEQPKISLEDILLFREVDLAAVKHLTDQCEVRMFPVNDILLSPTDDNRWMYVILDGSASVHLDSLDSEPIARVGQGESIGEMSALDEGIAPSAYVRVERTMTAMIISHNILMQLIDTSHEVAKNLLFLLSNRLRSGNKFVTNSKQLQQEFEQHANIDSLTGLYNRRWIDAYFERLLRRNREQDTCSKIAVLLADVDHFKQFNDEHGHLAGDQALRCVADALKDNVRPTDIVARYGGEEFLIILPNTSPEVAVVVANRIVEGMRNQPIKMGDMLYPSVTISAGIASLEEGDSFASLIEAADSGLYQAKHNGRDQAAIYRA